ncbi:MAG TPA: DUF4389 domain-containing protein, partial [Woeseiaceae bacterium]|nr:DUF4389 domain-containing protein [Woeseiaceae bacterium]
MSNETPRDHVPPESGEQPNVEENLKSRSTWLRLLYILVFVAIYAISRIVLFAVVALNFFWLLFTGDTNDKLTASGQSLATYTYELIRYMTFNTDV